MAQLRAIIIDEDRQRRETVRDLLPDYMDSIALGYGDSPMDHLRSGMQGEPFDIVLIYGDDPKSQGLYIYDWMVNRSQDPFVASLPVVVITEDEFSDRCIDFLEIGDVTFYEGDIDESRLFTVITEAIEKAEFLPEEEEKAYEETRTIDRIAGCSVKAPDDDGKQRSVLLDMESRMSNLEAAIERGKKRASEIRTLIDAAQQAKGEKSKAKPGPQAEMRREQTPEPKTETAPKPGMQSRPAANGPTRQIEINSESINRLKQKAMTNPYGAFNAQGTIKMEKPERPKPAGTGLSRRTIVIVDNDIKTRKMCTLFLTQNYNVVALDSGIKTVDYFVKNRADLLMINPVLSGMSGVTTVNSIRMQPGGANVPVMYIVGDDYEGLRMNLLAPNVVGILNKPVKRTQISQAVDGLFGTVEG